MTEHMEPAAPSKITVTPLASGGIELYYPPARNLGVAAGTGAFTVAWMGVVVFLSLGDAPLIFPIMFGGFGVLLVLWPLQLLFGTTRVHLDRNGLVVRTSILGLRKTRRAPLDAVGHFITRVGMQAGKTPYYQVHAVLTDDKTITAGDGIREKREADWLIRAFTDALEQLR